MRYNPNAARVLRELTHKDLNNNYSDYDILAGNGPLATRAKIRFLETILHERADAFDTRLQKIQDLYSLSATEPVSNNMAWSLNEFKLSDIEFTLKNKDLFFGFSATIGNDMITQTDRGTIAYPMQRGHGHCLEYVDITNKLVVYSNLRENFIGTFENFQYQHDYNWFKNLYNSIYPENKND